MAIPIEIFPLYPIRLSLTITSLCHGCSRNIEDYTRIHCSDCEAALKMPSREIQHRLHPRHPLTFSRASNPVPWACGCCGRPLGTLFFLCSLCDFALDPFCALNQPPLSIDSPKFHEHSLTLLPRRVSFSCNACGLLDDRPPAYVCLRCDLMVHKDCIYLPRVVKITRHPRHRLSLVPWLPPGDWSCGVCFRGVDNRFGGYSCSKDEGCSYFVHSKCATRGDVWDGRELEGEPEEPDDGGEDIKPFTNIDAETIHHSLHRRHTMSLVESGGRRRRCDACILPIGAGRSYSCTMCDFVLHETCANLPLKKQISLHQHSLTLVDSLAVLRNPRDKRFLSGYDASSLETLFIDGLRCDVCSQHHSGFWYKCQEQGCKFELDVRCASVSEPFTHKSHRHPLFLLSGDRRGRCGVCGKSSRVLSCVECDFALGMECATLPDKVRHRYYDKHLLTLACGEDNVTDPLWCEACELTLDPREWFYECGGGDCGVTLHRDCVLGKHPYMKPGLRLNIWGRQYNVVQNDHTSRPFCDTCRRRCLDNLVWKGHNLLCCSPLCLVNKYAENTSNFLR